MNLEYKIKPTAMILYPPMHSIWRDITLEDIDDFGFDFEHYSLRIDGNIFECESCEFCKALEIYRIWYMLGPKSHLS